MYQTTKIKIHWAHRRSKKIENVSDIRDGEFDLSHATRRLFQM
jgi:hypothetical protein